MDINSNQKGLNSSHLEIMQSRLTDEEREIRDNPARWIARKLAEDQISVARLDSHGWFQEGNTLTRSHSAS